MINIKKYIFILLAFLTVFGLFSPQFKAHAQYPACQEDAEGNVINSPCVGGMGDTYYGYKFLVPLPCDNNTDICDNGKITTFDTAGNKDGTNNKLGEYLNIMIRLIIGLCAVMAVVMIVAGGIEYMTSELISHKEAGKEKLRDALLGLLIALGAYALLNTINSDLLNADINLPMATVDVQLQEDRDRGVPIVANYTGTLPGGAAPSCVEGVVRTQSGIVACKSISSNVDKMITDAKAAGLDLSGGGYRTREQQIQTRIANCNGNTTDAKYPCNPPTALPGYSRHEGGVAFDMTCGGTVIQSQSNACFAWLRANASRYGLQNYAAEPWHWSTDGR